MMEMILEALRETGATYLRGIQSLLPRLIAMLSIFLVGWIIAISFAFVTRRLLGLVRFNRLAERMGAAEVLRRADLPPADTLVARAFFWLLFVGFLLSGVDTLGLKPLEGLLQDFVHFIPRLLVATAVLMAGLLAANFVWRATLLAAVNANLPQARVLSGVVRSLILVTAVAMALEQVAVARSVVLTAFAIAFGAIMLALAIAIGIGGAPIARRVLEQHFPERPAPPPDSPAHL
jgi:Mechanosensitive ion channel, conserved TM helix